MEPLVDRGAVLSIASYHIRTICVVSANALDELLIGFFLVSDFSQLVVSLYLSKKLALVFDFIRIIKELLEFARTFAQIVLLEHLVLL